MTSSAIHEPTGQTTGLPEDLAECLGAVRLTQLALEAVGEMETSRADFRLPDSSEGHGFRMLLTLLAYAYSRGVYSSVELAERVVADADLRYLATGDRPSTTVLRQFRRREGRLIRSALGRIFTLTIRLPAPNDWFLAESEASRRLELAMAADSYALDC